MIKSVTVTNHLGESLILELTRPDLSGFIVKEIDGLGPVKADINTTKRATMDGAVYNSASAGQRDITFQLQFYTTGIESIEDIRHRSYKYFPLKKQVTIRVETDNRISETVGYIESNEPNIFSNQEGCTVVVVCPDPYFYSTNTNETIFYGVEPAFEFPLFNDSSTEPLLELGTVKNKTEENVFNSGDVEVGMSIIMHATGDVSNVTIYNLDTRERMDLDTSKMPDNYRWNVFDDDSIKWTSGAALWYNPHNSASPYYGVWDMDDQSLIVSDCIPVIPGTEITYSLQKGHQDQPFIIGLDENQVAICEYDEYTTGVVSGSFIVPNNVKYIRISTRVSDNNRVNYSKLVDRKLTMGDTITINTTHGNKSITLLRQGQKFNILNCVSRTSKWFTLRKGDNLFAYKAETGAEHLQFRMENKIAYIGV